MKHAHVLALAITNRCPLRCDFCCVPPGPGDLAADVARRLVQEAIESECFSEVGFTGGEPLLRMDLVCELGLVLSNAGVRWGVTTGMGWTRSPQKAVSYAARLAAAGASIVNVSIDATHAADRPTAPTVAFLRAAREHGIALLVSATLRSDDEELPFELPFEDIRVEKHYVAPVGNADGRPSVDAPRLSLFRSRCPLDAGLTLSVWPDGLVYPCCSTYVVNKSRELAIGSVHDTPLLALLRMALDDPYLGAIRSIGFAGLIALTPRNPLWREVFRGAVHDACHLCSLIAGTSGALSGLRSSLTGGEPAPLDAPKRRLTVVSFDERR